MRNKRRVPNKEQQGCWRRRNLFQRLFPRPEKPPPKQMEPWNLFDTIGYVWGLQDERIWPEVIVKEDKEGGAYYDPKTHQIVNSSSWDARTQAYHQHERTHAAEALITPKREKRNLLWRLLPLGFNTREWQQKKSEEVIAALANSWPNTDKSYIKKYERRQTFIGLLCACAFLGLNPHVSALIAGKSIGRTIDLHYLSKNIRKIFDRYGEDGILLYMANPPGRIGPIGGPGGLETAIWERRMLRKGYLVPLKQYETHSLTEKGEEFLRGKIKREQIVERIRQMEKNREAQKTKK